MDGLDGLDWKSPGGVKYRAAYAANKCNQLTTKKERIKRQFQIKIIKRCNSLGASLNQLGSCHPILVSIRLGLETGMIFFVFDICSNK